MIIFQFGCKKDNNGPPVYTNGEGEIGTSGGTVKIEDEESPIHGAYVTIPDDAMYSDEIISIEEGVDHNHLLSDSTAILVNFLPDDLEFYEPVEIGLPFNDGANTDYLTAFYFDPGIINFNFSTHFLYYFYDTG